ncbi:transposase [Streptomyces sp. 5K101]|uniref:transposase n=1 Tax=Streptomyces sp. 5K101 TaxID=3390037 RepID=UPI003974A29A
MSGGDGLFEVDPAAVVEPQTAPTVPVKKTFRVFVPDQMMLLPPSLDEWLPQDHLARFVAELVDEVLDLAPILASYTEKRGFPPYDPRLMVQLLIYGYTTGVRSSRAIERKYTDDVVFRYLAAGASPDYRSISRFRARHLDALAGIFTQSLHLAQRNAAALAMDLLRQDRNPGIRDSTKLGAAQNSDGAYIQAYNAQAVVDGAHQIITAADVTTNPSDVLNYTMMLDQSAANTGIHPKQALVDAGYCSEANLAAAADRKEEHGTDTFMATGRLTHDEQVSAAPRGRIPQDATARERMARKLRTKPGRAAYSRRKAIVEPVFGQIMTCQDGRELLLRGANGARGEWRLLAACHNLRKIFRYAGTAGLAAARA